MVPLPEKVASAVIDNNLEEETPVPENQPLFLLVTSVLRPNNIIYKASSNSVVTLRMLEFL